MLLVTEALVLLCCCCAAADSVFNSVDQKRYIVLSADRLGFANRIRSVADWHAIAVLSGRTLIVSWTATADCNAAFTDLFQAGPERLKVLPFVLPAGEVGLHAVTEMAEEASLTSIILRKDNMFVPNTSGFVVSRDLLTSNVSVLVTDYVGVVTLEGLGSCVHYLRTHSAFLRSLVPTEFIRDFVKKVMSEYFSDGRMMIGVHARFHDPLQDWAVVPPLHSASSSSSSPSEAVTFGVGATLEHFADYMRQIEAKMGGAERVRFFIASNDAGSKDQLLAQFPDAVSLNGEQRRSERAGIVFATIEWLLLSESSLILHTHGSSFGVEAAQVHQRPLAGIYDGSVLHTYSVYHPYCGHLLYLKTFSSQGTPETYLESLSSDGTVIRNVSGKQVSLAPCEALDQFGLAAYCIQSD